MSSLSDGYQGGTLYQYSLANGRSAPVTTSQDLTSNMILFQPDQNAFSVYDFPRSEGVINGSMAYFMFDIYDSRNSGIKSTTARVDHWVIWQNQPPTCPDQFLSVQQTVIVDNQEFSLVPQDPDPSIAVPSKTIDQILTAYIVTLPTAGTLYQYNANDTARHRGDPITQPQTMIEDPQYRVVLDVQGTGRPYATFTWSADDTLVDNIVNGVITLDVTVTDPPTGANSPWSVNMNDKVLITLVATTMLNALNAALARATISALPTRGSLFQVLPDGSVGQRLQVPPALVTDPQRRVFFKPDPYTSDPSYTTFQYTLSNGQDNTPTAWTISMTVNPVHLNPTAQDGFWISASGNDIAIRFVGFTQQSGNPTLTALVTTIPVLGTLKQIDGTVITNASLPCPVIDTNFLTVVYSPLQNLANPSQSKRYTESFLFQIDDNMGDPNSRSAPATSTVQVGSVIKPPIVYSQSYYTLQNQTIIIQLNGTVQDPADTWTPFITQLPAEGKLYQMNAAQKGAEITGSAATPVADPNFYIFFEPFRFSGPNATFQFVGQNSEGVQSTTSAVATVFVQPVGFAPTVPATGSVTTPSSVAVPFQCAFYAGPTPPPTVEVYITSVPARGILYQWDSTQGNTAVRGAIISAQNITDAKNMSLPGVKILDSQAYVLYDPIPYQHGELAPAYAYALFTYIARDGPLLVSPAPSTVTIYVTPVNFAPVVSDGTVKTNQEVAVTIYLQNFVFNPSAKDGNTYVCIISALPTKGSLYQVDANGKASAQPIPVPNVIVTDSQTRVIYKPLAGTGRFGLNYDFFKFFAEDPEHFVKSIRFATISIDVAFVNKPPNAPSFSALMYENQGKIIQLQAQDPEGSPNLTTTIVSANLWQGMLFQFVPSGGHLPVGQSSTTLAVGGADNDNEFGLYYTYANYTGNYGGGYDHTPYLGTPITTFPTAVTDPGNRVVFLPVPYTHGHAGYQYIYGLPAYATSGTFTYSAFDGQDVSTTNGIVSLRVETVFYAPLAYTQDFDMDEDGFLVITLPIFKFDVDESPPCYILTVPTVGALYQYDGRNARSPKAEQILSKQTQVQDINPDGTPGVGLTVVYEPPKLNFGKRFANFSFYAATEGKESSPGMVYVNVNQINHRPTVQSFSVVLSGHNTTVPVVFNVTDVDYNSLSINITGFPSQGQLWTGASFDTDTYTPTPGTMLTPDSSLYYPPAPYFSASSAGPYHNESNQTTWQTFQILFDDFGMGGGFVNTGCTEPGTTVPCGYSNFSFRVLDEVGAYSDGFVEIQIQCGPSYVVNVWQTIGSACVTCPIGAICASEGQHIPLAEAGYWRGVTPTGLMFVGCLPPSACSGISNISQSIYDTDLQCADGYHGRMCAACDDGYYKLNDGCNKCSNTGVFWIVLAGVPAIMLSMWFILHVSRRGVDLTFFAIVLTYCQILAVYSQYHLTWPDSVLTALTVFSITHLNLDIFAVSCYYNTGSYSDKWKAKMAVIPGLALGVIAMVLLLIAMRMACNKQLFKLYRSRKAKRIEEDGGDVDDVTGHAVVAAAKASTKPQFNRRLSSGIANNQKGENAKLDAEADLAFIDTKTWQNNDPSAGFDEQTALKVWINYYMSLGVRTFTLLLFVAYLPICVKVFQLFNCQLYSLASRALKQMQ